MKDRLQKMFISQWELQTKSFGQSLDEMTLTKRVEYIRWNVLALTDELHEALAETSWKPWQDAAYLNRNEYLGELVDAWHFLMNLVLAVLGPEQAADWFYDSYAAKRDVNAKRQRDGYDGVTAKCSHCKRALDEPDVTVDTL